MDGTFRWYAGGGGGAVYRTSAGTAGAGGTGGGGAGGKGVGGVSGTSDTGGGGGGSGATGVAGGQGGSGIVIVRYVVGGGAVAVAPRYFYRPNQLMRANQAIKNQEREL